MQIDEYRKVSDAVLDLYEGLKDDPQSKEIIKLIDQNPKDHVLKSCLTRGVARLKEIGKGSLAEEIIQNSKEFAFGGQG